MPDLRNALPDLRDAEIELILKALAVYNNDQMHRAIGTISESRAKLFNRKAQAASDLIRKIEEN